MTIFRGWSVICVSVMLIPPDIGAQQASRVLSFRPIGATDIARNEYRTADVAMMVDSLSRALSRLIRLKRAVPLTYTVCGPRLNDRYDPKRGILLCYETLDWFERRPGGRSADSVFDRGLSNSLIWFVVAHEFAHSIARDLSIPLVGDVETSTDELAGVLMLEAQLGVPSLSGGQMFLGALARAEDDNVAYTLHGSSERRAHRLFCLSVGKEESINRSLVAEMVATKKARAKRQLADTLPNLSDTLLAWFNAGRERTRQAYALSLGSMERLRECEASYPQTVAMWKRLLGKAWIRDSPRGVNAARGH